MPLIYSLVSFKSEVQAEATAAGLAGNFAQVAKMLVKVRTQRCRADRVEGDIRAESSRAERILADLAALSAAATMCLMRRNFPRPTANSHTSTMNTCSITSSWYEKRETGWGAADVPDAASARSLRASLCLMRSDASCFALSGCRVILFCISVQDHWVYLCICDLKYQRMLAFRFLNEVMEFVKTSRNTRTHREKARGWRQRWRN